MAEARLLTFELSADRNALEIHANRRGLAATTAPLEVEIYFDDDGRDYLLEELSRLKQPGDHLHLMTPTSGMDDLSEEKHVTANTVAHHLRLTLI